MAAKKKPNQVDTAALLAGVDIVSIIDQRVPLKKAGAEYEACCPFHTEKSPSFKVSPAKQMYHCFGCGANGDAIKFVQEYDGLSFLDAVKALGGDVEAPEGERQPRAQREAPAREPEIEWQPVVPVPDDAEEAPKAHPYRGRPEMTWCYRDGAGRVIGHVYRFKKSDGGKETIPLSWMRHPETARCEWRWHSFAEPRPLYGLDKLAERPDAWVLLVEGEKCAEAAEMAFSTMDKRPVVMTWPGGSKAVSKVDWAPLKGCNIILWPDCDAKRVPLTRAEKEELGDDEAAIAAAQAAKPLLPEQEQPGVLAMERIAHTLLRLGEGTRARIVVIPPPGEKPDGWDVYDAINDDGMNLQQLQEICRRLRAPMPIDAPAEASGEPAPPAKKKRKSAQPPTSATAEESSDGGGDDEWQERLIHKRGDLVSCLSNVYDMLANDAQWAGVLAYDESAQRTIKRRPPPYKLGAEGEWEDQDDSRAAMWLGRRYGFSPGTSIVREAVNVLSRENAFHPIRDWLEGLRWDGTPRLDDWMSDYLGVARTQYSTLVARWYLIGMVARAMTPGCQFDYCLVLEGDQGLKKSTVLRALGGEWFGDTDLDLHNKDSMDMLRGKWLWEFSEMGSITRVESNKQKSFISRRIDEFRPAYGARAIKCPRQLVFAGTVNDWEWNKDPTGGRRFWPVRITQQIDVEAFSRVREQLFAEALACWRSGEKFWPEPEVQKALFDPVQLISTTHDAFIEPLADWLDSQRIPFSLAYAAQEALKIDPSKLTRDIQTRIGLALRALGCTRDEHRKSDIRRPYIPPISNQPAQPSGDEDDTIPF